MNGSIVNTFHVRTILGVKMSAIRLEVLTYLILGSTIQVEPVKQPIGVHPIRSGDMSHGRAPAFYDHPDHSITIFENRERRFFGWRCVSLEEHS